MRRSIQIVSACALILVVTGPGTGVSDGLAAEGEKLPCNNFCRTWMGYEAGARTATPAQSDETVTVKPTEVQRDPELTVDHSAFQTAFTTDNGDKLHHPKPKRKGERDTADVSKRRGHRDTVQDQQTRERPSKPRRCVTGRAFWLGIGAQQTSGSGRGERQEPAGDPERDVIGTRESDGAWDPSSTSTAALRSSGSEWRRTSWGRSDPQWSSRRTKGETIDEG